MTYSRRIIAIAIAALVAGTFAQTPGHAQRGAQATSEAARLFETLELQPGMTVGEIGAGGGRMTVEIAKRVGPAGHVYSTELDQARLRDIRDAVSREQLANVTVVEAGERSTNLPDACCDAIFMRDVYHHFTHPTEIARSVWAALKPGGRLAVIDFPPRRASPLPDGVPSNRAGHGISSDVIVEEVTATGLSLAHTIPEWPEPSQRNPMFLVLFRKAAP